MTSPTTDGSPTSAGHLPRVLFVSVNPFSRTSNNGKTFASFFAGYPKDSIAQLYFHRELPSSPVCERYFRITDEDLLKDLLRPWRVEGERVSAVSTSSSPIPAGAHGVLKRSRLARLVRQVLWTRIPFDGAPLTAWLDEFRPEVVFFCGGDAASLYPKVTSIAERYGSRLVLYVTDDYVLPVRTASVSARLMRRWTRRVFQRLSTRADLVLTIGEAMSSVYARELGVVSTPVMNMVDVPSAPPAPRTAGPQEPLVLLYAGSLHSNRWRVLGAVIDAVQRLEARGIPVRLRVFGPEPSAEVRAVVDRPPYAAFGGLLMPDELSYAISDADVLLHVEADDPQSKAVTALSVSTKIPEYLAAGRCVLAIGPRDVASIDYLASHEAAVVVDPSDSHGLDHAIESLARKPELREQAVMRAFGLAQQNHDAARTRRWLWSTLAGFDG